MFGKKAITFKGLLEAAAIACGKDLKSIKIFSFDPDELDKRARKLFPIRLSHFYTDISLIQRNLDWKPRFEIYEGLADSYQNDYKINSISSPDFSDDIKLIGY